MVFGRVAKGFGKTRKVCTMEFQKKATSSEPLSDGQYYKDDSDN